VQIHFDVKDDSGKVEEMDCRNGFTARLFSFGWNAKTLKAGDKITVTVRSSKTARDRERHQGGGGNAPALTTGARRVRSGSGEANGSGSRVLQAASLTKRRRSLDAGDAGRNRLVSVMLDASEGATVRRPRRLLKEGFPNAKRFP